MTSSNKGALRAYVEKIPARLQRLVLDMANSEGGSFHLQLEAFCNDIKVVKQRAGKKELMVRHGLHEVFSECGGKPYSLLLSFHRKS